MPNDPTHISLHEHEFRLQIVASLTKLEVTTKTIVDQLKSLAILVEHHDAELDGIKDTLAKHVTADTVLSSETSRWEQRLTPILKTGGLILVGLALGHGSALLKVIK